MEIKDIINEEILSHNERQPIFRFTDNVENPSFLKFQAYSNDYDVDITESNISVTWRTGFLLNDNGIENFMIDIESVQGSYHVELHDKQSDELAQENDRDIKEVPWRFHVIDTPLEKGGALYVTTLSFDFETKVCSVDFTPSELQESEIPPQYLSKFDK
jgi:hypothetical protein